MYLIGQKLVRDVKSSGMNFFDNKIKLKFYGSLIKEFLNKRKLIRLQRHVIMILANKQYKVVTLSFRPPVSFTTRKRK